MFLSTGMNKMIVNHLDKLFVTNDAATIIRELEVRLSATGHFKLSPHPSPVASYRLRSP